MWHRISELFARHLWLSLAASWLLGTAMVLLLYPGRSPLSALIRVMITSAGAVWIAVRRRRREERAVGGTDNLIGLAQMLRRGQVPSDPGQRRAMGELVDRQLHRGRHRTSAMVFMVLLFGAVTAMTAATASPWRSLGFGVFSLAFLVYLYVVGGVSLHRLERMRGLLASENAPAGHHPHDRHDRHDRTVEQPRT
ncbi:hypothetical protein [Streptomyces sp. CA-111067]|uniref:hypothetical protein n=1 Tax=Streptomyces sp. CA-111067 TaxID=3240046 RepID=UPI003D99AEE4